MSETSLVFFWLPSLTKFNFQVILLYVQSKGNHYWVIMAKQQNNYWVIIIFFQDLLVLPIHT